MNKFLKRTSKYIIAFIILAGIILPSVPVGGFDFVINKISSRRVVDQTWLAKNDKSLVDVFNKNTVEAATDPIVGLFSPAATWTYVANVNLNLRQPDPRDGDLMIATIAIRPAASTVNTPAGWTLVDSRTGTDGAGEGIDTGSVGYYVFSKVSDGTEGTANQTFTENGTTSVWGGYITKVRSATGTYDISASGYSINGDATNWNGTLGADIGLTAGDLVLIGAATNGNLSAHSAQAIAATGISSVGTSREHGEFSSTTGNDIEQTLSTVHIWAGTNSATPTITYTQSVASSGVVSAIRIRQGSGTRRTDTWVRSAGVQIAGTTSVAVAYPEHDVGDRLILFVANRYTTSTPTTPANWTLISNSFTGGIGTNGVDAGTARISAYYRDVSTKLTGTQSVTVTSGNVSVGQIVAIHKDDVTSWSMDSDGGADASAGTAWSTTGTSIDLSASDGGDLVLVGSSINTDAYTYTAHALSASGITFGDVTETGEFRTTSGSDMAFNLTTGRVATGSNTGLALTHTKTASGSGTSTPTGPDLYIAIKGSSEAGITVSGTVYQTDETTPLATKTVHLRVNGTLAGTGAGGTGIEDSDGSGNFSFTGVSVVAGDTLTLYLDGETEDANTVIITDGSTGITSVPLYDDHLVIRADNASTAITILDLLDYDNDQNATDMLFDAEDATPDTLVVEDGVELHIYTGDTFTPGGTVTTSPSASSASVDGDVHIDGTGTLSMGTNALSIGGDFNNEGTFSKSTGQTTTFTATATGHTIVGGGENFDSLTFNGSGGGWTFSDANTVDVDLTITAGTLTVGAFALTVTGNTSVTDTLTITSATGTKAFNGNVTINNGGVWNNTAANVALTLPGSLQNDGTFNAGSGAHTFSGASKTIGGANSITLASLVPTSLTNNGTLIVTGVISGTSLTNGATGVLKMGATPTVTTLTATAVGNDVYYTNTATIKATTYDDLFIDTGSATVTSAAATVNGNLTVTSGTTFSFANSAFTVTGTTSISGALVNTTGNNLRTFTGLVTIASGGSVDLTTATVPTLSFGAGVTVNSGAGSVNFGSGTTTLTATQAFTSAGDMTFGAVTVNSGVTLTNSVAGTLSLTSLTLASGAGGVVLPTGSTTTSSGTITFTANATATNTAITLAGTAVLNAGAITFNTPSSTGTQAIDVGAGTLTVSGLTSINGGASATSTISASTGTLNFNGNVTIGGTASNGRITTTDAGIVNLAGTLSGEGTFSWNAGTTFNTSGTAQISTTLSGGEALPNLNVLSGTTTLNNQVITINGATNITGSLVNATGANAKTFTGLVTINSGGGLNLSTATAPAVNFGAGIINNSDATDSFKVGGAATLIGDLSGSGTGGFNFASSLTISSGTTTNNYTAGTVTTTGTLTFTGNWTQAANTNLDIMGNTAGAGVLDASASGNTVEYGASGTQTAKPATYRNLTISGTSAKTFATTPTVNGILSIEGDATATVVVTSGVVTYGASATLQYNTTTSRTSSSEEWITTFNGSGGVIIGSTGTITLDSAKILDTGVPLTINSGATLNTSASNFQITFGGNFDNNGGTFTANASPIVIANTATQSIDGYTTTGLTSMTKTSGTATLQSAVSGAGLTINGSGGTLNLGSGLTHTFSGDVTLTAGTLNGGSSTLTLSNTSATVWNGTGSVFSPGTSTVNFSGANQTLAASTTTFNNLTFSGSGTKTFTSATTINGDFDNQGGGGQTYATWNTNDKDVDVTLDGTFLVASNENGNPGSVRSTIGKSSGKWYWEMALTAADNSGWGIGVGNSSATLAWYPGQDANGWMYWFYTGDKYTNDVGTQYEIGTPPVATTGNTMGVLLDMDNGEVSFRRNNGDFGVAYTGLTGTIYAMVGNNNALFTGTANFGNSGFTYSVPAGYNSGLYNGGASVTIATGNQTITLKGNFTNTGTALDAGSSNIILDGTATQAIAGFTTTGTVSMTKTAGTATFGSAVTGGALTIDGVGGTLNLGSGLNHTFSGAITVTNGTLVAGTNNITAGTFSSSNSNVRSITMGSGIWTLTGTGSVWDMSTSSNSTLNSDTSTIKFTDSSATGKTFAGGGKTYNNFWFAPGAGSGNLIVSGNNTFNNFKDDGTTAHSILFTTGSTQSFTSWTVTGNPGQLISIDSTTTGTHTLQINGSGSVNSDYLNIQHSIALTGGRWFAGTNSTNNQGVDSAGSGWIFQLETTYRQGGSGIGGEGQNGGGAVQGGGGQGGGGGGGGEGDNGGGGGQGGGGGGGGGDTG